MAYHRTALQYDVVMNTQTDDERVHPCIHPCQKCDDGIITDHTTFDESTALTAFFELLSTCYSYAYIGPFV